MQNEINLTSSDLTPDIFIKNGQVLVNNKEEKLGLALLKKAIEIDNYCIEAIHPVALKLYENKKYQEALNHYIALNKIDNCYLHLSMIGHCYYHLLQDELAMKYYREALMVVLDTNDQLFEIYKNMGNLYVKASDFDGANEFYNKAFAMNSQSDVLLVNLGTLAIQQNDFGQALSLFREAILLNSKNDKAWVGLALVHNHLCDFELAFANIENAIDCNPQNKTAVQIYAKWCFERQKYQSAIEALTHYMTFVDHDRESSLLLIQAFVQMNQIDFAELEIERALLWEPMDEELLKIELEMQKFKKEQLL